MKPNRDNPWVQLGRYATLAFVLPSSIVVGYLIGWLLDRLFGTKFFYIIFLLLGIAAGFRELIREMSKDDADGG